VHHRPAREHLGPHCSLNTAHTQANACGGGLASARPSSGSVSSGRGVVLDTRRRWRGREKKRSSEVAPAAASGEARAATRPVRARVGSSPPTRPARAAVRPVPRCAQGFFFLLTAHPKPPPPVPVYQSGLPVTGR
jgi:hypothetical protein